MTGGSTRVFVARNEQERALGPFRAGWHELTGYKLTHDRSPRTPFSGAYATDVSVPSAGTWLAMAAAGSGANRISGVTTLSVTDGHVPAALGSRAVSVRTPVATTPHGLAEVCTREPPCHMHYVSLSDAIVSGRPTVAIFSTPLLCESRMCAPVTDEVILVFGSVGKARANFIHVEEFLPGPHLKPPAPTLANQSPGFKAYGFTSEPWTLVIDSSGIVRQRYLGIVTAPQIRAALEPLIS